MIAYQILNQFEEAANVMSDLEAAHKWRDFHVEEYLCFERAEVDRLSAAFEEKYPEETHVEAAIVLDRDALSKLVTDMEPIAEHKLKQTPDVILEVRKKF